MVKHTQGLERPLSLLDTLYEGILRQVGKCMLTDNRER